MLGQPFNSGRWIGYRKPVHANVTNDNIAETGICRMIEYSKYKAVYLRFFSLVQLSKNAAAYTKLWISTYVSTNYSDMVISIFENYFRTAWSDNEVLIARRKMWVREALASDVFEASLLSNTRTPKGHNLDHVCRPMKNMGDKLYIYARLSETFHESITLAYWSVFWMSQEYFEWDHWYWW